MQLVAAALATIIVFALVSAAAIAQAAEAPASPAEIAFVRATDATNLSTSEIYRVREDGRALVRLTKNRFADSSPVWSPDGSRILFVSNRDGDDELYVMNANGAAVRRLTRNKSSDVTPAWSPDGRLIAFASDRARRGEHEIWLMPARGGAARRLIATVNHPTWQDSQFSPTWSRDSKRLILSMTASDANPELYRVNANGRGLRRLTFTRGSNHEYGDDTMPDWAGTGGAVVFVSNREQRSSDLWLTDASGAGQRPIVRLRASDDWHPHVSPDGRRVAFTKLPIGRGGPSIWVIGVDGSGARHLTNGTEPSWRPAAAPRP